MDGGAQCVLLAPLKTEKTADPTCHGNIRLPRVQLYHLLLLGGWNLELPVHFSTVGASWRGLPDHPHELRGVKQLLHVLRGPIVICETLESKVILGLERRIVPLSRLLVHADVHLLQVQVVDIQEEGFFNIKFVRHGSEPGT